MLKSANHSANAVQAQCVSEFLRHFVTMKQSTLHTFVFCTCKTLYGTFRHSEWFCVLRLFWWVKPYDCGNGHIWAESRIWLLGTRWHAPSGLADSMNSRGKQLPDIQSWRDNHNGALRQSKKYWSWACMVSACFVSSFRFVTVLRCYASHVGNTGCRMAHADEVWLEKMSIFCIINRCKS